MLDNHISYSYEQLYKAVKERLAPVTMLSDFKEYTSGIGMYGFCIDVSKNLSQLRCFYGLFNMNFVYDNVQNSGLNKMKDTISFHQNTDCELLKPHFFAHKGEEYIFDILALNYDYEREELIPDILIAAILLQIQQENKRYWQSSFSLSNACSDIIYYFLKEAKARFVKYETKWWSPSCKHIIPIINALCNIYSKESFTSKEYMEALENIITSDANTTADNIVEIYKNIFKDKFVSVARIGNEFLFDYYKKYAYFKKETDEILSMDDEEIKSYPAEIIARLQSLYTNISNIEIDLSRFRSGLSDDIELRGLHKDKFPRKKAELLKTVEDTYVKVYNVIKADPSIDLTADMSTYVSSSGRIKN